jgi:dihydrofolate reductase
MSVEIFTASRPSRPFVEVAIIKASGSSQGDAQTGLVQEMRSEAARVGCDGIIVNGSATLGQGLAESGLVDRYHLLVFPVLLGAGLRLFSAADRDKTNLDVVESQTHDNGITTIVADVRR